MLFELLLGAIVATFLIVIAGKTRAPVMCGLLVVVLYTAWALAILYFDPVGTIRWFP